MPSAILLRRFVRYVHRSFCWVIVFVLEYFRFSISVSLVRAYISVMNENRDEIVSKNKYVFNYSDV